MHYEQGDNKMGVIAGVIGGMGKYFLDIQANDMFTIKFIEAGVTALVCGFLGVLGKHLFTLLLKRVRKHKT